MALQFPVGNERFRGPGGFSRQALGMLFLVQYVLVSVQTWLPLPVVGSALWTKAALLILATALTLVALSRQLPWQNVIAAAVLVVALAGFCQLLGTLSGFPCASFAYTREARPPVPELPPWAAVAVWIPAVLSSRGTSRLILRPWRKAPNYGFWMLGVTALLTGFFGIGLEAFCTQAAPHWPGSEGGLLGQPALWVHAFAWVITSLVILVFTTPFLINKRPVEFAPDYYPCAVWLLLNLLFASGAAASKSWTVAAAIALAASAATVLSILGAKSEAPASQTGSAAS